MKGMPAQFTIDTHQQVCKKSEFLCVFRSSISDLQITWWWSSRFPCYFLKSIPFEPNKEVWGSLKLHRTPFLGPKIGPEEKEVDPFGRCIIPMWNVRDQWQGMEPCDSFLKMPRFRVLCLGGIWRDNDGLHMVLIRPAKSWGERWQLAPLLNCHPGLAEIFCWEIWGGYDKWWSFQEIFWEWVYKRPSIWLGDYPVTDSYWFQKRDPAPVRKSATSKPFC